MFHSLYCFGFQLSFQKWKAAFVVIVIALSGTKALTSLAVVSAVVGRALALVSLEQVATASAVSARIGLALVLI